MFMVMCEYSEPHLTKSIQTQFVSLYVFLRVHESSCAMLKCKASLITFACPECTHEKSGWPEQAINIFELNQYVVRC